MFLQENFQENITHLTLCFESEAESPSLLEIVDRIQKIVETANNRHSPIMIYGKQGSGKTSLIKMLYQRFEGWLTCRVLRIIRFVSSTPRSSYNLELLRIICQQICIALKLPEGFLPKDASFDPIYINNWFQSLLKGFDEMNQALVIFIDDIHLLNPLDSDMVSMLSWLPISLSKKVHIICTTGTELDSMRLTAAQKERLKNSEFYFELPSAQTNLSKYAISCVRLLSRNPPSGAFESTFKNTEATLGKLAIARLSSLITCSEYGLSETELLEILMPTNNGDNSAITTETGNFNFSSFTVACHKLGEFIKFGAS